LPFAFASHFAAAQMMQAVDLYRRNFRPSTRLQQPYLILGVNIVAADTDDDARLLATSGRQAFASLRRGMPTTLPPPNREFEKEIVPVDWIRLEEVQSISFVGSAATIAPEIRTFISRLAPQELIVVSHIFDHAARLRSYEIVAEVGARLGAEGPARDAADVRY
jgi:alkanesulfonate monooxygenase SsuD/methylene tetrahydromethanopterin reductase-like flavin-dependent oxidoreductase (luciferase family)